MNEALRSILCEPEEGWIWEPFFYDKIKFNLDGTGELWFLEDHTFLFATYFRWTCSAPSPAEQPQPQPQPSAKSPATTTTTDEPPRETPSKWGWRKPAPAELLGRLTLSITLERRLPTALASGRTGPTFTDMTARRLTDTACQPKDFAVTLERGNFAAPHRVGAQVDRALPAHRYALRLSLDRALVPPRAEFADPAEGVVAADAWWRITEYVARPLPASEHTRPAMNDPAASGGRGSCVVS